MAKRNWKNVQARDLRHAQELCLEHAREKRNLSVDSVAEIMGLNSKWTLYKWMEAGNLTVRLVKNFENVCGIDFISRWMVTSGGKLVIEIPRGKVGSPEDIQALQTVCHEAIGALMQFYGKNLDAASTLEAMINSLERMAWHKSNVEKFQQPELPIDDD